MSDLLIAHLHPLLRPWYQRLVGNLWADSIRARMIQGWRDPAYQDKLHAQHISPLTGLQSKHCFMLAGLPASKAFDLGIFENAGGAYVTNGQDERYLKAGKMWADFNGSTISTIKTIWGGDFSHGVTEEGIPFDRRDWDHFEME